MLGPKQEAQAALFYEFSLEDHVPQDHLLRSIDRFVDLSSIRTHLAGFYSHTGRPSVDPELLIRMLLVGYCFGIRSERRLCEEVHLNLAYRWFCRLDLSDRVPDHSTFSKNRHGRFRESELLRHLFETTVARCIAEGLVSGQRMAIDASLIEADANKQNSTPKEDWDATHIDPADAPRAVREYLDTLDKAAFGAASEVQPKFTSHSDPASQWTAARKGPAFFSYSDNYLIDTDHGVILDVEGTRSIRQAEVGSTQTMLTRVKAKFGLIPEFVGRLPVIATLEDLDVSALVKILVEPKNALVKQYAKLFDMENVELSFTDDALTAIAKKAIERKTGARGLRSILEGILLDTMFDLPSMEGVGEVVVDKDVVAGTKEPIRVFSETKKRADDAA